MTASHATWVLESVDWHDRRAVALREAMDAEISPRYAEVFAAFDDDVAARLEEDFALDPASIVEAVLVIDATGEPVGHAALRVLGDELEVKRVYVRPSARGRGASRALMAELERLARARGAERLVLQTGDRQPEAIALYESIGYRAIEVFPPYQRFPASRCFAKPIR